MKEATLRKAILALNASCVFDENRSHISAIDSRAILIVTVVYLVAMLSVPLQNLTKLIWFAAYPIVTSPLAHERYGKIFRQSLYLLPLFILIGIFNPLYEREIVFTVGKLEVTAGWISFISIIVRGLLSFQALLLLIKIKGFPSFCAALAGMGVPRVLVTQLLMLYRYIAVLLDEALVLHYSRIARGYNPRGYRMWAWGSYVGQLLVRSIERSRRIHLAMKARGFDGLLPLPSNHRWVTADTVYCFIWCVTLIALRTLNLSNIFNGIYSS